VDDRRAASQQDVDIVPEPPVADPAASPADKQAVIELLVKPAARSHLRDRHCDATFERIRSAGAEVLQEPIDQPYGVSDRAFRDPSGNMLRFTRPRRQ
jgi:uncharacterized glyoxalase superfamily protein PhnB